MTKLLIIQHAPCESPGTIADVAIAQDIHIEYIKPFEGTPIPKEMGDASGLVVMGGPMGVYEYARYPFLRQEMRLIEQALRDEKPALGVCLGSQLLASALGATVTPGKRKEIGWYPLTLREAGLGDPLWQNVERAFVAYHWHGDVFALPAGAMALASSEMTQCQAFRYGPSAYGFLFHMEISETIIREMVATFEDELAEAGVDGRQIVADARRYLPRLQEIAGIVFRRWANLVAAGRME